MAKNIEMEVRLPRNLADEVEAIAKLAGVSPATVIRVMLATELWRHQAKTGGEE